MVCKISVNFLIDLMNMIKKAVNKPNEFQGMFKFRVNSKYSIISIYEILTTFCIRSFQIMQAKCILQSYFFLNFIFVVIILLINSD